MELLQFKHKAAGYKLKADTPPASEGISTYSYILTDESIDAQLERMNISGIDLTRFKKNPVALYIHDSHSLPIGKWVNIKKDATAKIITADLIIDPNIDERIATVEAYIKNDLLNGVSIGFASGDMIEEEPESDAIRKRLKNTMWRDYIIVHNKSELYEASVCPIPSNSNALRQKSIDLYESNILTLEQRDKYIYEILNEKQDRYMVKPENEKAGAVLSKANKEAIKNAKAAISKALEHLDALVDPMETEGDEAAVKSIDIKDELSKFMKTIEDNQEKFQSELSLKLFANEIITNDKKDMPELMTDKSVMNMNDIANLWNK